MNSFRANEKIKVGTKKKDTDFEDALIVEKSKSICNEKGESFDGLFTFDVAAQQFEGSKVPKWFLSVKVRFCFVCRPLYDFVRL